MYYIENPQFGKKRLGRTFGLVPPPPLKGLKGTGVSTVASQ